MKYISKRSEAKAVGPKARSSHANGETPLIALAEQADTPQTKKAERIPFDPLVEMDIMRMIEERLRQTERSE